MSKTDIQKSSTGRFLREYKVLECLRDVPCDEEPKEQSCSPELTEKARCIAHPFNLVVEDGDIRLFSQTERITYGVILPWDNLRALVVPFSRYDNPAESSEFYAENADERAMFQRVYQVWNARTVQKSLLSMTWRVGRISPREITRLKQMLRHDLLGEKIPAALSALCGFSDFRLARIIGRYHREESENFKALDEEDMALETALESLPEFKFQPGGFDQLMAAAGAETLSPVYVRKGKNHLQYLAAMEADNFRRVKAGKALPVFCWFSDAIKSRYHWRVAAFRTASSRIFLGAGLIEPEDGGAAVRLRYPVKPQEVPELLSPADIEIIILEP